MSDKDEKPSDSSEDEPIKRSGAKRPSTNDEIILEAIKHDRIGQVDTVVDFSKTMITLVSGFFVAYFVLLSFLGFDPAVDVNVEYWIFVPPAFLILSIVFYAVSAMPLIFLGELVNLDYLESISKYRITIMKLKFIPMLIGMGLFISGLISTLIISLDALV